MTSTVSSISLMMPKWVSVPGRTSEACATGTSGSSGRVSDTSKPAEPSPSEVTAVSPPAAPSVRTVTGTSPVRDGGRNSQRGLCVSRVAAKGHDPSWAIGAKALVEALAHAPRTRTWRPATLGRIGDRIGVTIPPRCPPVRAATPVSRSDRAPRVAASVPAVEPVRFAVVEGRRAARRRESACQLGVEARVEARGGRARCRWRVRTPDEGR